MTGDKVQFKVDIIWYSHQLCSHHKKS